jgi:transposase-like protein
MRQPSDAAEALRYVFVEKVRCPRCGSDELKTTRSVNQGDGSTQRTTNCRSCGHHFFVIEE